MAYFQTKIGWKRLRRRENKNYHSVSFQLDALQKISKKQGKKFKKLKNTIPASFQAKVGCKCPRKGENKNFKPKQVGKGLESRKINLMVPFRSSPTRNRKFQ